jgi:hypothetical protein
MGRPVIQECILCANMLGNLVSIHKKEGAARLSELFPFTFSCMPCPLIIITKWPNQAEGIKDMLYNFILIQHPSAGSFIYGDHLAWPLVVGALLVIAKRGARPQTLAKLSGPPPPQGKSAGSFIWV